MSLLASTCNFGEQPACAVAKRADSPAFLKNEERVVCDSPAGGVAALTTTNREPHQKFAFTTADWTGLPGFHWLTCTESASLCRVGRHVVKGVSER